MPDPSVQRDLDAIAMELPGRTQTSWAYLLEDANGGIHLIDCGADSEVNRVALSDALGRRGRTISDVASVVGTHVHFDHIGMAAHIQRESGALVRLHARDAAAMREEHQYGGARPEELLERWGVPAERRPELMAPAVRRVAVGDPIEVAQPLEDGEELMIPGWDLIALATPGHTAGHICVVDRARAVAFVGDHVLADQNPGVGLGGRTKESPTEQYLTSLDKLEKAGVGRLLPGHGTEILTPRARIAEIRAHHHRRRAEVASKHRPGNSVWHTTSQIRWSGGWDRLAGMRLFSAMGQVEDHIACITQQTSDGKGDR